MSLLLALFSAGFYGAADFLGGFATKRAPTIAVMVLSGSVGVATALLAIAILAPAHPQGADLAWGAAGGLVGGAGLFLFYQALGSGTMSVIAPIAGVTSIAVPVIVGVASGERPGPLPLVGVVLAVLAIACVSVSPSSGTGPSGAAIPVRFDYRDLWTGTLSGLAFGFFYVIIHRASPAAGVWPLVAARCTSVAAWSLVALIGRRAIRAAPSAMPVIVSAGALDMIANILWLLALQRGMLSIVATIASLYPATTLILARIVLRERLGTVQGIGLGVATAAVLLISAG